MSRPCLWVHSESPAAHLPPPRRRLRREGSTKSDQTVECSGRIVLECGCGERLVLLGLEEDWRLEERADFGCKCGKTLTLADHRLDEDVLSFRRLMRSTLKVPGG